MISRVTLVRIFVGASLALTLAGVWSCDSTRRAAQSVPVAAKTLTYEVKGMTCTGCEEAISASVKKIDGVKEVAADYKSGRVVVTFDPGKASPEAIGKAIEKPGYKVGDWSPKG